ncbi:arylformamidase [Tistlia consotensis]|uniref:Arylformamidase n=1 Tax=Tistlia consotensis USBA 355 TaxID=560819 RepID=A0A1Y6BG34_9PROT|nr:alpha/beta hydrolase [Tistlia consotensis]SMF09266.1 arylformamidase [Tistlia consotensis USBA 355]SNR34706.1 arylformamidase [Tistlia consotensis]
MGGTLWRGYDKAALDRQINLRARTPEHVEFFAHWADDSRRVRAQLDCRLDLPYGEQPLQTLDYFPAGGGEAPLVAFIHGGYWQSLDKGDFSYLAPAFVEAGVAFASINYTLAPAGRIPQMVEEIERAVAWLYENAEELGFDREGIVVAGHSAGGHLAAMAAVADWSRHDLPRDLLRGACAVSGLYQLQPIRLSYQQEVLQLDDAAVAAGSPQALIPEDGPPILLAVGDEEPEEFRDQQAEFLAAWQARGLSGAAVPLPGRHHFSAIDALGEKDHALHRSVCYLAQNGAIS